MNTKNQIFHTYGPRKKSHLNATFTILFQLNHKNNNIPMGPSHYLHELIAT